MKIELGFGGYDYRLELRINKGLEYVLRSRKRPAIPVARKPGVLAAENAAVPRPSAKIEGGRLQIEMPWKKHVHRLELEVDQGLSYRLATRDKSPAEIGAEERHQRRLLTLAKDAATKVFLPSAIFGAVGVAAQILSGEAASTYLPAFAKTAAPALIMLAATVNDAGNKHRVHPVFNFTNGLIAYHSLLFALQNFNPELVRTISATPDSFLFHTDLTHLAGNMAVLYPLGTHLEKGVGSKKMLLAYLASGLFGGAANMANPIHLPEEFGITYPQESFGASNAVMGLLGLGFINAIKDKKYGLSIPFGMAAGAVLGIDMAGEFIDKIGHAAGFSMGVLGGAIESLRKGKPAQNILQQRQTQRDASLPAGLAPA